MKTFTYSEAEQNFSGLLELAKAMGRVFIRKDDGETFVIMPETVEKSPFDVEGIDTDITTEELLLFIEEAKSRQF